LGEDFNVDEVLDFHHEAAGRIIIHHIDGVTDTA
jgi:hypothetical protein